MSAHSSSSLTQGRHDDDDSRRRWRAAVCKVMCQSLPNRSLATTARLLVSISWSDELSTLSIDDDVCLELFMTAW